MNETEIIINNEGVSHFLVLIMKKFIKIVDL